MIRDEHIPPTPELDVRPLPWDIADAWRAKVDTQTLEPPRPRTDRAWRRANLSSKKHGINR
jgi:hypothetical protein